jgi:hypothetical protein
MVSKLWEGATELRQDLEYLFREREGREGGGVCEECLGESVRNVWVVEK